MKEIKCGRQIIAFVINGTSRNQIEIDCDSKDCLDLRIWGNENNVGAGINRVAITELSRRGVEEVFEGAYVRGSCSEKHI